MVARLKKDTTTDIVGGNIATYAGAKALVEAGADAVKVGVGPGAICTTRIVAGVGVPQITAIMEAARACRAGRRPGDRRRRHPILRRHRQGDRGRRDTVMLGGLLAGSEESPGDLIFINGKQYKSYRGMGSLGAMQSRGQAKSYSKDRYFQHDVHRGQAGPRGRRGPGALPRPAVARRAPARRWPARRRWATSVPRRSPTCSERGQLIRITAAGLKESHPHDIQMTVEAPNYHSR